MTILLASELSGRLNESVFSTWFLLTVALPALILVPAGYYRSRLTFVGIPIAYIASWIGFAIACKRVAGIQVQIADEHGTWVSDTGLTFAPIFFGTPIAGVVTLFVAAVGIGLYRRPERKEEERSPEPHVPDRPPDE